jgi:cysteine-rich repeat protein
MPAKPVDPVPLPVPLLPLAYPTCAPCHRRPASAMGMVVVLAVSLATGCSSSKGLQHGSAPSDSGATAGTSLDGRTDHDSPGSATGGDGPATTGSGGAAGAGGSDTTGSGGSDTTENGGTGGVRLDAWASENPDVVGLGGASGTRLDGAAAGTGGASGTRLDGAAAGTGGAGGSKIDSGSGETTPADAAPKSLACGDGILVWPETCDDGNTVSRDGCSADCQTSRRSATRARAGKRCSPLCGDGKIVGSETCDDGNTTSGDGCSSTCVVEPGSQCPNPGKACTRSSVATASSNPANCVTAGSTR